MNEKYQELKKSYLSIACKSIHKENRLYKRIYNELSEHMDDMYEDFVSNGIDENSVPEMVVKEMGNAEDLNKELYNANKKKIFNCTNYHTFSENCNNSYLPNLCTTHIGRIS